MNSIILTSEKAQSERLYRRLCALDPELKEIQCLTKSDLHSAMTCEYIFSTWYMPSFSRQEIKKYFPDLKAIFYAAGTVKGFAEPFLQSGVKVFSAASANGTPVAEFTVAQIILANKGYFSTVKRYRWPMWSGRFGKIRRIAENHPGNYNTVIGILGCGAIGSKVVELLKPYDLTVKVYDPYISSEKAAALGVECVGIEELFASCDVISNHMPDIPETKGVINADLLQKMPRNATLINTGRGAQIVERELASVLKKRNDLTAVLDVTTHEPLFPWSPLYWRKNVFITPHIAGSLSGEIDRMIDYSYRSYVDFIMGKRTSGEINISQLAQKA